MKSYRPLWKRNSVFRHDRGDLAATSGVWAHLCSNLACTGIERSWLASSGVTCNCLNA